MAGITIKLEGVQKVLDSFNSKAYEGPIQQAINKFGVRVEMDAKKRAPVDEGHLKGSIFQQPGQLSVTIGANVSYAAYIEFGTRKFAAAYVATLPPNWQAFAATHKGKGQGDYFDFLNAILDWVMRKGIANRYSVKTQKALKINVDKPGTGKTARSDYDRLHDTAYAIALSILRKGIKPHPYLYPSINNNIPLLLNDIKAIKPKL